MPDSTAAPVPDPAEAVAAEGVFQQPEVGKGTSTNTNPWRLSHPIPSFSRPGLPTMPTMPTLPTLPNFRAALLGYLSEIELALGSGSTSLSKNRYDEHDDRLMMDWERVTDTSVTSGDESGLSETEFLPVPATNGIDGGSSTSTSTALFEGSGGSGLRNRLAGKVRTSLNDNQHPSSPILNTLSPTSSTAYNHTLLAHLSTLREEALNYLPSLSIPLPNTSLPLPTREWEWLRSLPSKLVAVDLCDRLERDKKLDVDRARRKMIELVHAILPSEEWAGWEKLGWEEQDEELNSTTIDTDSISMMKRSRSASFEYKREQEEDEDEPEYLFPNRTPASAQAYASSRRRAVRSKSLGASSFPFPTLARSSLPKLQRCRTAPIPLVNLPFGPSESDSGVIEDDDGDDLENRPSGEEEEDLEYINSHPSITDTKLTKIEAKSDRSHTIGPTVQEALKISDDGNRLIEFDDLPFVWRNNEHIKTGYRFIPLHLKTGPVPLIKSAFTLHNETVNIHSHFVPTIFILLCIPLIIYHSPLPNAHFLDTTSIVTYLLAAVSCLVSSAGWHVLSGCASKRWFEWGACVDYIGISWLIAASFGTVVYNGFYCHPRTVLFYSSINFSCGVLGSTLPFQKWFNERRNKKYRISFFLFLCFAMFAPIANMFYLYGWTRAHSFFAPFGMSILSYITGLVFYAFHFPECVWPGRFDLWGASHQIWHAGIVLAIILHYRAIFVTHNVRYDYSCSLPDAGIPVAEVIERFFLTR